MIVIIEISNLALTCHKRSHANYTLRLAASLRQSHLGTDGAPSIV